MQLKDRSRAEGTSNPLFLFQFARWNQIAVPYAKDGEYCYDGEGFLLGDAVNRAWEPRSDSEYLTNEQLAEMESVDGIPCAQKEWTTQYVFLTREEAQRHGENFSYRYPDGWRVYAVPCLGTLPSVIERGEKPKPLAETLATVERDLAGKVQVHPGVVELMEQDPTVRGWE